ncbi:plasmid replication initiator TrfA [Bordetella sp. 15P40C-2]|uniref:plasmid replication initiator TrfA n=1 Tax=Bordetella sp. 15P40C-2 TaxID=2572246 RepID=UPI00132B1B91|nr:plasmid replication initiator TrfA [Bordetella sp. 15P40C-2]MVW72882.1 plasmid-related transcriptional repressor protein [Bordetella sp. 15P40C-2]
MSNNALAQIEEKASETHAQIFLPGMREVFRAMPNHIARSSLFAPVARGRRKMHDNTILTARGDAEIRFSGKQLDEAQADVWMQAMKEAQNQPLGRPVTINRAEFLREIGRSTQGENYRWLHRTFQDLVFAMLVVEVTKADGRPKLSVGKTRALHLITGFDYDETREQYTLTIDPRWSVMYANREFALVDWEKRRRFGRNQDMAKTLQRLVATSSNRVQRYALDWLKAKMEYRSPMRKFREALASACAELERLEIVAVHKIEDSTKGKPQLALWLPATGAGPDAL